MKHNKLILICLILSLLNGCAAVVVGGVAAVGSAIHDRRTTGAVVDDQGIEIKATDLIHKNQGPGKGNHIKVTSYNGILLITGEVKTAEQKNQIEQIASNIEKVRRVVNELEIRPQTSVWRRSRDSLLTGQVKSSLLGIRGIKGFDPTRVKVVSVRKTVYLMGLVTAEEAEAAAKRTSRVPGVHKVVKVFEYIEADSNISPKL